MAYPNSPEEVRIMSECQAKVLQKHKESSWFHSEYKLTFHPQQDQHFFLLRKLMVIKIFRTKNITTAHRIQPRL